MPGNPGVNVRAEAANESVGFVIEASGRAAHHRRFACMGDDGASRPAGLQECCVEKRNWQKSIRPTKKSIANSPTAALTAAKDDDDDGDGHDEAYVEAPGFTLGEHYWLFVDYMSLPQFYRAQKFEQENFRAAMQCMHLLYAHERTYTLVLDELTPESWFVCYQDREITVYQCSEDGSPEAGGLQRVPLRALTRNRTPHAQRGWCQAELQWSRIRCEPGRTLHCGLDEAGTFVFDGLAPCGPETFRRQLSAGQLKFTHRDDQDERCQDSWPSISREGGGEQDANFEMPARIRSGGFDGSSPALHQPGGPCLAPSGLFRRDHVKVSGPHR